MVYTEVSISIPKRYTEVLKTFFPLSSDSRAEV